MCANKSLLFGECYFIKQGGATPRHAEEISIRPVPIPATRAARRVDLPIVAALFACHLFAAPVARADEFDWVYFPMYPNDTAHAVHLSSLKFRPDGLLSAATRYPRTRNELWTEQESQAGWYTYDERLIDCETGFFAETATSLLDQDGAKLATRTRQHAEQIERLESQLQEARQKRWPHNSDVFLACAAASSPAFKKHRAAQAAKVQPLFSNTALVTVLSADTDALSALMRMRYDFRRIEKKPTASAADLFLDMRAQFASWRRSINAAYVPLAVADERRDQAVLAEANRQIEKARLEHVAIKRIKGAMIEYVYPTEPEDRFFRPAEPAGPVLESARIDCEYGVSVPVARQEFHSDGRAHPSTPLRAKAVMAEIKERYGAHPHMDADGPFGGFFLKQEAAAVCQLVAQVRGAGAADAGPPADDESGFTYGIKPGALAKHATLAAMLLAIRDARGTPGR